MTTKTRTLAKALHTVTAVAKLARYLSTTSMAGAAASDESLALAALAVLGYSAEEARRNPALLAACVKAVQA